LSEGFESYLTLDYKNCMDFPISEVPNRGKISNTKSAAFIHSCARCNWNMVLNLRTRLL